MRYPTRLQRLHTSSTGAVYLNTCNTTSLLSSHRLPSPTLTNSQQVWKILENVGELYLFQQVVAMFRVVVVTTPNTWLSNWTSSLQLQEMLV